MRTSPLVLVATVVGLALTGCNDKIDDAAEAKTGQTRPELLPFDTSGLSEEVGEDPSRVASDDAGSDEPDETEPTDTEPEPRVVDPMPGDTVSFDTRADNDPLCAAAQDVVDADEEYQKVLEDAVEAAADDPGDLNRVLRKIPITKIRDAYDDLAAELPDNLRRAAARVRDFTVDHGRELRSVEDLEQLSTLIAEIEDDPNAPAVSRDRKNISDYTERECDLRIDR